MDDERKQGLAAKYAWDWFSYHAAQRLTAFRFFLIMVGIVGAGFFKCVEQGWVNFGRGVASFGALICIASWLLDIRNTELVNCGRAALDDLEKDFRLSIRKDDAKRKFFKESLDPVSRLIFGFRRNQDPQVEGTFRGSITKHQNWFRLVQGITCLAFVLGAIFSPSLIAAKGSASNKFERSKLATKELLSRVDPLSKIFEDFLNQSTVAKEGFSDTIIRGHAKAIVILAREVASECRRQPVVETICREYETWSSVTIPLFEQIASSRRCEAGRAVKTTLVPKSKDLQDRLVAFTINLRKVAEESN